MSAVDSTEGGLDELSTVEAAAARGELPEWTRAKPTRREHMRRVATLLEEWARRLGLGHAETRRWAAAGWLHDALRDEDHDTLRGQVAPADRDLPGSILHGPAAALRLKGDVDPRIETAVRYHTIGHPSLDRLGRALYLADFLEPGRDFAVEWRAALAERMPDDLDEVLLDVLDSRLRHLLEKHKPIRPETAAFWSDVVGTGRK